jgi:amidase
MDTDELLLSSATYLASLVRSKKLSSKELVRAAIHKVRQENPQLNAVIHLREEKALQEADNLTDTGQPFLGVPILIKGLGQALKGEPDTNGNVLFKE